MEEVGLFCMGAFIGSITTISLQYIHDTSDWRAVLAVILPAVFSGVALTFTKQFNKQALGCYPLGLVIGLMWNFMWIAKNDIGLGDGTHWWVGMAQIAGTVAVTGLAVAVVGIPACRYVRDLWRLGPNANRPAEAVTPAATALRDVTKHDQVSNIQAREEPVAAKRNGQ